MGLEVMCHVAAETSQGTLVWCDLKPQLDLWCRWDGVGVGGGSRKEGSRCSAATPGVCLPVRRV